MVKGHRLYASREILSPPDGTDENISFAVVLARPVPATKQEHNSSSRAFGKPPRRPERILNPASTASVACTRLRNCRRVSCRPLGRSATCIIKRTMHHQWSPRHHKCKRTSACKDVARGRPSVSHNATEYTPSYGGPNQTGFQSVPSCTTDCRTF